MLRFEQIYTFRPWGARVVTVSVALAAFATACILGLPFHHRITNVVALIGFAAVLVPCGHGAYVLVYLLATITAVTRTVPKVAFGASLDAQISGLYTYYSTVTVMITLAYAALVAAVWAGPYGLSVAMIAWLTVIGFYPIAFLALSVTRIHILMRNVKLVHIDALNAVIQDTFSVVSECRSQEDVETLERLMGIQTRLARQKEWLIAVQSLVPLAIVLTAAATQVLLAVAAFTNP